MLLWGDAVDESVQAQAAQVVAHLAGVVVLAEVSGDEPAKAFVGAAAGDGVQDVAEGAGQSHGALIPEAQRSGSLALMVGLVDALKERRADGTALAGTLDHKQPLVDAAGLGDELGQMLKAGEYADVGWLVDDGLDSQRAAALEVLLDARVLVAEVDADVGAGREDARAERLAGGLADLAGEHQRDLFGAPDADVVLRPALQRTRGRGGGHRARACARPRFGASRAPTETAPPDRRPATPGGRRSTTAGRCTRSQAPHGPRARR